MKRKAILIVSLLILVSLTGCTKRCRCIKFNLEVDYYSKAEVTAQGKSCENMRYYDELHTPRYSYCEWTYTD